MHSNLSERPLRTIAIDLLYVAPDRQAWSSKYVARSTTGLWWLVPRVPDPNAPCSNVSNKAVGYLGMVPVEPLVVDRYRRDLERHIAGQMGLAGDDLYRQLALDAVDLVFAQPATAPLQPLRFRLMERHPKVRPSLCDVAVEAAHAHRDLSRMDARVAVFSAVAARDD
jgi:hypothetical protein